MCYVCISHIYSIIIIDILVFSNSFLMVSFHIHRPHVYSFPPHLCWSLRYKEILVMSKWIYLDHLPINPLPSHPLPHIYGCCTPNLYTNRIMMSVSLIWVSSRTRYGWVFGYPSCVWSRISHPSMLVLKLWRHIIGYVFRGLHGSCVSPFSRRWPPLVRGVI